MNHSIAERWSETGFWEISPVNLCCVNLTSNGLRADVAHLKRGSVTLPRVADYTFFWLVNGHSCGGFTPDASAYSRPGTTMRAEIAPDFLRLRFEIFRRGDGRAACSAPLI
jgi:hypothetical protein